MLYDTVDSPIGLLLLSGAGHALSGLLMDASPAPGWRHEPAAFAEARDQLDAYFAGERSEFDLPLAPQGTPFQLEVWRALSEIPTARPRATASWPRASAAPARPARWERRTGATRSP